MLFPKREDAAAGAGDPDVLVKILNGSLDVVVRFQDRVGVEDKEHVGIERARLIFDRGHSANRVEARDDEEVETMKVAKSPGQRAGIVPGPVIYYDDFPRTPRLSLQRFQATEDVRRIVECRVSARRSQMFGPIAE
jgi:hypothetical protein